MNTRLEARPVHTKLHMHAPSHPQSRSQSRSQSRPSPPRPRHALQRRAAAVALLTAAHTGLVWAQAAAAATAGGKLDAAVRVDVVGTAPLPGLGVDRDLLPYGSVLLRRDSLDRARADTLSDALARGVPGLQVNDIQGSPYQGDVTFRGHRASGLLGAAQGLSVYLDGVRINEPFGDVVNWDLVPESALRSVTLLPGANPAFGLNTLGGAIVLQTLSGQQAPGTRAEAGFGSFGRLRLDTHTGGRAANGWHHLVAGSLFDERGWRDHSPGRRGLVLAKLGQDDGATGWQASLLTGRSTLVGNGLVPARVITDGGTVPDLLATRRQAVFTHPDRTRNELLHLALNLHHSLDARQQLQALAWVRDSRRHTVNGDLADDAAPGHDENAALNTTRTRQRAAGLSASVSGRHGGHFWQWGGSAERSRVHYRQHEQEGFFDSSRGVLPGNEEAELSAEVRGHSLHLGLYATDTWRLAGGTAVTGTLRWNRSRVANTLSTVDDDSGVFQHKPEERFTYTSLNPALGVAQPLWPGVSVFANVARNTRVPTVIELGCADPAQPCRLPAGLQSDPYLKQVRSTSLEAGLRWTPASGQRLELSLYRNDNRDDILFSSVSATGQRGYFRNVERTRHQGLDLSWQGRLAGLDLSAAYSRLDATYQAHGVLRMGERNIGITPGMRIAGLPRHSLKFSADGPLARGFSVGADLQVLSRRVTQGNEDGRAADDEDDRLDLSVPGYAVVNLRATWQARPGLELLARVNNAFNRQTASYGALAETPFDARGHTTGESRDALFLAPGAPRSLFIGLRWLFF